MLAFDYYNFTYFVSICTSKKLCNEAQTLDRERVSGIEHS